LCRRDHGAANRFEADELSGSALRRIVTSHVLPKREFWEDKGILMFV
jgi:hypothetical protein